MSTMLVRTGAQLKVEAYPNGKAHTPVKFVTIDDVALSPLDTLNLTSAAQRAKRVAQLPESYRSEAGALLEALAVEHLRMQDARSSRAAEAKSNAPEPDPEPWPDEVNGAHLLGSIRGLVNSYVVLPPSADIAVTLWIAHTYLLAAADFTPYLLITSPVRECGKTTLLEVLLYTAFRAQMSGGITAGALYRRIDGHSPAILLDELDTRLRGDGGEALRGVLNTGFQRNGKITICVGDNHEDKDFRTFCAKALAGIGRPWDTVISRSIPVRISRASKDQIKHLRKIRGNRINAECEPYRSQLRRWSEDVSDLLLEADPEVPEQLGARQSDVWRPLLAIADAAGGEWPSLARGAAIELHGVAEDEGDYGLLLLTDVREIFAARGNPAALFSESILEELVKLEHRPWPEYRHGQPLSKNSMAQLFKRFDVRPKLVREGSHETDARKRGYRLEWLTPLFDTYLPAGEGLPNWQSDNGTGGTVEREGVGDLFAAGYEATEREALRSGL